MASHRFLGSFQYAPASVQHPARAPSTLHTPPLAGPVSAFLRRPTPPQGGDPSPGPGLLLDRLWVLERDREQE